MKKMMEINSILGMIGRDVSYARNALAKYETEEEGDGGIFYIILIGEGVDIRHDGKVVTSVFLYSKKYRRNVPYLGELPFGLKFSMARDDVRILLGEPSLTRGAKDLPVIGHIPPFDRYDINGKSYTFHYGDKFDYIERITISML